jgi:hypothetical protein
MAGVCVCGWTNGGPVHILSTANGWDQTNVSHQIGKDKCDVCAPKMVKAYNAYIHGIDHHGQLRAMC